jgi:hypothetical protein
MVIKLNINDIYIYIFDRKKTQEELNCKKKKSNSKITFNEIIIIIKKIKTKFKR